MRPITDHDVYRFYWGDGIIGNMYRSPIPGREDSTPSFGLYEKRNRVLWKDHGLTNQFGNEPENFVQYMRGIELTIPGYYRAKELIQKEVKIGIIGTMPRPLRKKVSSDIVPYIYSNDYQDWELDYWGRFDFTAPELIYEDCWPLRKMSWTMEGNAVNESKPGDPAFVYWWHRNPASYKLYFPLRIRKDRFRQFNVTGIIEGWNTLIKEYQALGTKFDIIFVISSSKDRFVVKKAFRNSSLRVGVINPRGEGDRLDIIAKKDEIIQMSHRQVILYDADDPGFIGAQTLAEFTGFEYFDTRNKLFGHKDFADMKDSQRGQMTYNEIKQTIFNLIQ